MKQQQTVHLVTQNALESKTDVVLTVYTCQTKSVAHYTQAEIGKSKLYSPNLSVILLYIASYGLVQRFSTYGPRPSSGP